MAVVNKPVGPRLPLANVSTNTTNNSTVNTQANVDALKRKFQRVNQEIVKQNVMLQENLARTRQEHHSVLQENVRLKGRIVALESKLHEAEGVCIETKKAIGDRIEILEAIGGHLIQVTKFLRVLSTENEQDEGEKGDANNMVKIVDNIPSYSGKRPSNPRRPSMHSIPEEDIRDLTDHISDVSINESESTEVANTMNKQQQAQDDTEADDEFSMRFLNVSKRKRTPQK